MELSPFTHVTSRRAASLSTRASLMSVWVLKVAKSDHFIIHTHFFHFCLKRCMPVALKLFAEASQVITHALFQLVVSRKTASSGVHPSGAQKWWKSEGAKSGMSSVSCYTVVSCLVWPTEEDSVNPSQLDTLTHSAFCLFHFFDLALFWSETSSGNFSNAAQLKVWL